MCRPNILIVDSSLVCDLEKLRKSSEHKDFNRTEIIDKINNSTSITMDNALWNLMLSFGIILKFGKARGTKYHFTKDMVSLKTLENLRNKYDERLKHTRKDLLSIPKDKETRIPLNEDFCINYLKERGYVIGKIKPNMQKIQTLFTKEEMMEFCDIVII